MGFTLFSRSHFRNLESTFRLWWMFSLEFKVFVSLLSSLEDQLENIVIFHTLDLSFLPDEVYVGFSASKFDFNSQLNEKRI